MKDDIETYSVWGVFVSNNKNVLTLVFKDARVLDRIQSIGRSNQGDISSGHFLGVGLWEKSLLVKSLVEVLTDSTMSSISSDKDIAMGGGVVAKS